MNNHLNPLTLSAVRGARLIALDRLDSADDAADKLAKDPDDLRALHDLRVALRRVRSWLRAFKAELEDGSTNKDRKRLRDLVDETNRGRDADVQVAWLEKHAKHRDAEWTRGAERLIEVIEAERETTFVLDREWFDAFEQAHARLAKHLATVREPVRGSDPPPPTLAVAIGARLPELLDTLSDAMSSIHASTDETEAHAARIAAKRLRYVLEPAADVRGCKALLERLKRLQDDLGALHDMHLLEHRTQEASVKASPPDREALEALSDALAAKRETDFSRIDREWLSDDAAVVAFSRGVALVAKRLEKHPKNNQRR